MLIQATDERDRLAEKYNSRIVDFLEQAAVHNDIYALPDSYTAGVEAKLTASHFYGRERFKFTNNQNDEERIVEAVKTNAILDTQPLNITETKAWNLRPRSRDMELGPDVRHRARVQMERVYDCLKSKISPVFTAKNLTEGHVHD